jgi:hypothetical protein
VGVGNAVCRELYRFGVGYVYMKVRFNRWPIFLIHINGLVEQTRSPESFTGHTESAAL